MSAPAIISSGTAAGGPPVGGTGITNTIPRWTGPSTLGDSGFVDDGSTIAAASRMLAIGTSGTTGARVWIQNNSSGNTLVLVSPSGAGSAFGQLIEAGTNASDYALNIRQRGTSNPLVYVRGDGNVGIGTASPASRLHVNDTSTTSTTRNIYTGAITAGLGGSIGLGGYWNGTTETVFAYIVGGKDNATSGDYGGHLQFWTRPNGGVYTERARIDSAGRFFIGASTTPNVATVRSVVANAGSVYTLFQNTTANVGGAVGNPGSAGLQFWATSGALGAETYTLSFSSNATGLDVSTSGYGLKLPATPGNADTQTLDCYRENTWTPTITGLGNCSAVTISDASFTQIGRLVTIQGKIDLTVTAATTATSFQFSLPVNRDTTTLAGCGAAVDNTNFAMGGGYNAGANNTTAYVVFPAAAGFGAGSARIWAFSYSYFTAT